MMSFVDFLATAFLRGFAFCMRKLTEEQALAVGAALGRLAFFLSGRRSVAYADIKACLGSRFDEKQRWQLIRHHYRDLGQTFVEILRLPLFDWNESKLTVPMQLVGELEQIKTEGCVLLSAHFGNWEILRLALSSYFKKFVYGLARDQKFPRLNNYINELRQSTGLVIIQRGFGVRDLLRSLRRKEWVGILGDQDAGRHSGLILPFFGRKTTVPTGAFEIAARMGVPVYPTFIVRTGGKFHRAFFEKALRPGTSPEEIEAAAKDYLKTLERFISDYPSQWLWETKRWKYTWTKRILILSDGKPGHVKQSEAVAAQMQTIETQYGRPGMEYPLGKIEVRFKSSWHRKIFPWFAFFLIPFAQGRLRMLSFFFDAETQQKIVNASADFIISAGSSLVPLNLCLAKDSRAKSIVLMKPAFPFNLFHYDLAVVPSHDTGRMPEGAFRTVLAPCLMDPVHLEKSAEKISRDLPDPYQVKMSVFLGGNTRHYELRVQDIQTVCDSLERLSPDFGDYLITTSRRTPVEGVQYLKEKVRQRPGCQMLVVASEDPRPEVAPGMMGLAEILIVTEDSISMISEAVNTGKQVVVITTGREGLPAKHRRFRTILERESAVVLARPEELEDKILKMKNSQIRRPLKAEQEALRKRLQEIL